MSTTTATSEYLVFCHGTSWEKRLSPADIENAMKQCYDWFERLSKEGKMRSGHRLAAEGKIVSRPKAVTGLFKQLLLKKRWRSPKETHVWITE